MKLAKTVHHMMQVCKYKHMIQQYYINIAGLTSYLLNQERSYNVGSVEIQHDHVVIVSLKLFEIFNRKYLMMTDLKIF